MKIYNTISIHSIIPQIQYQEQNILIFNEMYKTDHLIFFLNKETSGESKKMTDV